MTLQSVILFQIMATFHGSASQQLSEIGLVHVRVFFSVLLGEDRPGRKYRNSNRYRDCKVDPQRLGHGSIACRLPVEECHTEE
jgi:hypothetical protein